MLREHLPPPDPRFTRFSDDGTSANLNRQLAMRDRERVGREASPIAAVVSTAGTDGTFVEAVFGGFPTDGWLGAMRDGQVPMRSRRACAAVVSVAVGCASNRRRSIGSPVSSQ